MYIMFTASIFYLHIFAVPFYVFQNTVSIKSLAVLI